MTNRLHLREIKGSEYFPLFDRFIADSGSGNRLKRNGRQIRNNTLDTYIYVEKLLRDFSKECGYELKLFVTFNVTQSQNVTIKKYYKDFYKKFTDYLYDVKDYYDNYVSLVIKTLRAFFNYLKVELNMPVGEYHRFFYCFYEDIPVVTISPEQLNYLIFDKVFNDSLPEHLVKYKDIFVFGCSVALREGDLSALTRDNLVQIDDVIYLSVRSKKTETSTLVRLPKYCVAIIEKYKNNSEFLLPQISNAHLNRVFKVLARYLKLNQTMIRYRSKRGERHIVYKNREKKIHYSLADHITTHTMRRTAITTMLNLGMDQIAVRKISGHSPGSKEFFKYVNLAQSYMDEQTSKVYRKIAEFSA